MLQKKRWIKLDVITLREISWCRKTNIACFSQIQTMRFSLCIFLCTSTCIYMFIHQHMYIYFYAQALFVCLSAITCVYMFMQITCVYVCAQAHVCIYLCTSTCMYMFMHEHICVYVYAQAYVYMFMQSTYDICFYVCAKHICVCLCTNTCVYMFVHKHMRMGLWNRKGTMRGQRAQEQWNCRDVYAEGGAVVGGRWQRGGARTPGRATKRTAKRNGNGIMKPLICA